MKKAVLVIVILSSIIIFVNSFHNIFNTKKNLYTTITTDDLITKQNNRDTFTVFFFQRNCMACKEVTPIINNYIKKTSVPIYAIDLSGASKISYLVSVSKISETPTVIYYKNGVEVKRLNSIFTKEELDAFQSN